MQSTPEETTNTPPVENGMQARGTAHTDSHKNFGQVGSELRTNDKIFVSHKLHHSKKIVNSKSQEEKFLFINNFSKKNK